MNAWQMELTTTEATELKRARANHPYAPWTIAPIPTHANCAHAYGAGDVAPIDCRVSA